MTKKLILIKKMSLIVPKRKFKRRQAMADVDGRPRRNGGQRHEQGRGPKPAAAPHAP
ncbi:MAG TPA: hypothetical protein VN042_06095 [Asticcacaulis sp.]|nr:hypothetical protein [Asticcacaulis sp.]